MSGDRHVAGAEDLSPELLTAAAVFSTLETSDAALLACERISKRLRAVLLSSPVYRNKCKKILARAGPLSGVDVQAERLRGGAGGRRVVQAVLLARCTDTMVDPKALCSACTWTGRESLAATPRASSSSTTSWTTTTRRNLPTPGAMRYA